MTTLKVSKRDKKENKKLKKEGFIPAVFYGNKEKSTPVSVALPDFLKVWKEAGESSVITLEAEGGSKEALIKDVDLDPVTEIPRHADFYVFEKGHKVEVSIPLEFVGSSPAVKELGGTLVKVLHELNVEAEPKNLPHDLKVDISSLVDFDSQINAQDIKLPEGVELLDDPEEVVALVEEAREEEEEEEAPADISEIEVEKKGKKEEEGAEEGGEAKASGDDSGDSKK